MKCEDCSHAEMCKWIDELGGRGCDFGEPCDDAISRKAVEEITWEEPSYTDALNVLTEVRDKVRALPSVTQKSKTGHWIVDEYGIRHCPFCNAINNTVYDSYCPNCGARMIEPQEKHATNEQLIQALYQSFNIKEV